MATTPYAETAKLTNIGLCLTSDAMSKDENVVRLGRVTVPLLPPEPTPTPRVAAALTFNRPPFLPQSTSNEMLLKAVKASALGVKDGQIAEMLGVPVTAISYWVRSKEWKALREQITQQVREILTHQVADMAAKALNELSDRLDLGEKRVRLQTVKQKDGNKVDSWVEYRVPLSAGELTSIANALFDRADRLERQNKGQESPEMEAVAALARKLAHLDAKEIQGEHTTTEFDAEEEAETSLQNGVQAPDDAL